MAEIRVPVTMTWADGWQRGALGFMYEAAVVRDDQGVEQSGIAAESEVVEAVRVWQAQDRQQQVAIDITIDGKWRRRCGLPEDGVPAVVVAAVRVLEALSTARVRPCAEVAAEAAVVEAVRAWHEEYARYMSGPDDAPDSVAANVDDCECRGCSALRMLLTATLRPCAEVAAEAAAAERERVVGVAAQACAGLQGNAADSAHPNYADGWDDACAACAEAAVQGVEALGPTPAQPPAPTHYLCSRCARPLGIDRARCNSDPDGEPICTRCLFTDWPEEPAPLAEDQPPRWQCCPVCCGRKWLDQPISAGATGTAASPVPCPTCGGAGMVLAPPTPATKPDCCREALKVVLETLTAIECESDDPTAANWAQEARRAALAALEYGNG